MTSPCIHDKMGSYSRLSSTLQPHCSSPLHNSPTFFRYAPTRATNRTSPLTFTNPFHCEKHIPNSITSCNLICGCISIHYAMSGALTMALLFIVLGAVFDFFDGFAARLLGVASPIGKELDSLADVVTFGVAPAAMVFTLLSQHSRCSANGSCPLGMILPYTAFLIAAFSALRLAKFNLDTRQSHSFIGLPTPANALFWGSLAVWLSQTSIQVNLTVF